ncbi:MAG TPA: alpha/beta fold hydrolase [Rhodocyclaceae bacterium]|nr:alpha/beta fold hydrolase [Rhodocyclaceae bacterium]
MTTWILLRGLTREQGHWGDFPERLGSALAACDTDVVTLDLPGSGQHWRMRSPARVEDIASFCRSQAASRRLQPPFNIVGLSLGGMVAVAWAGAFPDEVAALVLINTSARSFCPPWQRLRPRTCATLLRILLARTDSAREAIVLSLTSSRPARSADVVRIWTEIRRARPVSIANAMRQILAALRYGPGMARPAARMLVLASTGDILVHPLCSRRLAKAWTADYAEHPTAGHDLPLDDGDWVARLIARWWAGGGQTSP